MTKKTIIISLLVFILLFFLFAMVGYFNYDSINDYIENDMWTYKEPIASVSSPDIMNVYRNSDLITYTADGLSFYNANGKLLNIDNIVSTSFLEDSKDNFMVILSQDSNVLTLYENTEKLWTKELKLEVKQISVNKNGYVSICFSQTGYKSGVTVFSPTGENLLTTYLASTYAVDTAISNDNKQLVIAQVNIAGIKPQSSIKIIDIIEAKNKNSEDNSKIVSIGNNEIVTDIDYSHLGDLFILTDIATYSYTDSLKKLFDFDDKYTLYAKIDDVTQPIVVEQNMSDIFSYSSKIKTYTEGQEVTYELNSIPQQYDSLNKKIAFSLGEEVIVLNDNLTLASKISVSNNILAIKFIKGAKFLAIVYKDKIEFVKL